MSEYHVLARGNPPCRAAEEACPPCKRPPPRREPAQPASTPDRSPVAAPAPREPGALHEVAARATSDMAAASGFTLALTAWAAGKRATLWIAEDMALAESGALYGPGLRRFRLATGATDPRRGRAGARGAVGDGGRLALPRRRRRHRRGPRWPRRRPHREPPPGARRRARGRHGFLLRAAPASAPIAAASRWIVGPAPAAGHAHGPGPPRLAVNLTRNGGAALGSWRVEWNSVEQRFELATDRQPVAAADCDRPDRAAVPA